MDVRDEEKLVQGEPVEDLAEEELEPGQPNEEELKSWPLLVDGSRTKVASEAGLVAVGARTLAAISDSQLVVGQVNGECEAKKESMEKYLQLVKELIKDFQAFNISQVPKEENMEADQLARLATTKEDLILSGVMMQYLDAPSIVKPINVVQVVEYKGTWADPIVRYIKDGEFPSDKIQARKLKFKAARLSTMKGKEVPNSWNDEHLKKYYV
ncbi:hypothetical protein Vadar_023815 [Vaccinium darrowii]|uniref:Uncharacterized protein n=1 Tax=Vaccinium darrowii TaxID=229202 RepID=A0ACB7YFC5_9ERIC|nr:hypothetical protein Vadar_023815 [Vaccinium darrowii]